VSARGVIGDGEIPRRAHVRRGGERDMWAGARRPATRWKKVTRSV